MTDAERRQKLLQKHTQHEYQDRELSQAYNDTTLELRRLDCINKRKIVGRPPAMDSLEMKK